VSRTHYDHLVIGGGFYGCCLALFLASISSRVLLVEAEPVLMNRASRVNQARIHTGFHYPRSALTAVKSMVLHRKFMQDFPDAVVSNFQMLYAIARSHSKVSAQRFFRMFRDMGAPIRLADARQASLFDSRSVEGLFACDEAAFDCSVLRHELSQRLEKSGLEVRFGTRVMALHERAEDVVAGLSDGGEVSARHVFNVTYSGINTVLDLAGLPRARLKHELTEVALVEPPEQMQGLGVTVMDGPFFSCMPYPTEGLYSLTHVRYTPHRSWTDEHPPADSTSERISLAETRVRHMIADARRLMPAMADARYIKSLAEVKTVLLKNERDDGRPILYQRLPREARVISILGAKIDNIYDLFELVRTSVPELSDASDRLVMGRQN
jgi:glycine/D-amino acid oxidase-like deaminating enzyme